MFAWGDLIPLDEGTALAVKQYGEGAASRLRKWREILHSDKSLSDAKKLEAVNRFFNSVPYVIDLEHWGKADYWATPLELLASNGGDCEDYALAKYFTLTAIGIPAERLRITYVLVWIAREQRMESHMVLAYYPSPDADPLILDNLIPDIKPASARTDIKPILSFNADGLWSAKQRAQNGRIGDASKIKHWNGLLARMRQEH